MDPHSRAPKKNTIHGNEVLLQDTTHLIQRPCYQEEVCAKIQQAIGPQRRPPDDCKEIQTAVVWSCLPFIRSGQNHLARHSQRGKKTRQTEEVVGRQHQGMDRPGVQQVPEGSGEQGKMEKTGYKIICGAPMTLAVKGLMMMIMMTMMMMMMHHLLTGKHSHSGTSRSVPLQTPWPKQSPAQSGMLHASPVQPEHTANVLNYRICGLGRIQPKAQSGMSQPSLVKPEETDRQREKERETEMETVCVRVCVSVSVCMHVCVW